MTKPYLSSAYTANVCKKGDEKCYAKLQYRATVPPGEFRLGTEPVRGTLETSSEKNSTEVHFLLICIQ